MTIEHATITLRFRQREWSKRFVKWCMRHRRTARILGIPAIVWIASLGFIVEVEN